MKIKLKSLFGRWTAVFGRAEWILIVLLVAIVIACLCKILFGDSPWTEAVNDLVAAGEKLSIRQRIAIGFRYGIYAVLACAVLLLVLTPWWAAEWDPQPGIIFAKSKRVNRNDFIAILVGAVLCAAWFRVPMMSHGFWNDEELAFRKFNYGEYKDDGKGELQFKPVPWDYAFFYTISGNNHVGQTVLSKATHELWLKSRKSTDTAFSEAAVRFGPVVFGLLTILAIPLALRSVGLSVAGIIAAWVLALHPWHIEYSTQARGYSGMLFFIVLTFWSLGKALANPKWNWWLLFGTFQCLYLLHFAGAIYVAAATNAVVFGVLIWKKAFFGMRRWFVANVLCLMGFVIIMAPSLMAIFGYLTSNAGQAYTITGGWMSDLWTHLSTGASLNGSDASLGLALGERELAARDPLFLVLWRGIFPAFLIAVLVGACLRLRFLLVFFGSLILAAGLAIGHSILKETILLEWYLIYLILGVAVAFGLIGEFIYRALARRMQSWRPIAITLVIGSGIVWAYGITTLDQRNAVRFNDIHPIREAVISVIGGAPVQTDLKHEHLITASVGAGADQFKSYDPAVRTCKSAVDLKSIVELARATARPLIVYCNGPKTLMSRDAALYQELEESGNFQVLRTFKGVEEFWSVRIYQLK